MNTVKEKPAWIKDNKIDSECEAITVRYIGAL